jgi:hypothetical protein
VDADVGDLLGLDVLERGLADQLDVLAAAGRCPLGAVLLGVTGVVDGHASVLGMGDGGQAGAGDAEAGQTGTAAAVARARAVRGGTQADSSTRAVRPGHREVAEASSRATALLTSPLAASATGR